MSKNPVSQLRGVAGEILDLLADAGRDLTLGHIQQLLDGYHELPALSAALVRLQRRGLVAANLTERTAHRGRRVVKAYRLAKAKPPDELTPNFTDDFVCPRH